MINSFNVGLKVGGDDRPLEIQPIGESMNQEKIFFNYCWEFYGPNQLYGKEFFNNTLTKKELEKAIAVRSRIFNEYELCFDSIDRELVRDIMLILRNPNEPTEHFK